MVYLNASLKRRVFNWVLKFVTESKQRTEGGNAFHSLGATAWNERSPLVLKCVWGATKNLWPVNLRLHEDVRSCIRSEMYGGAWPCRALKVRTKILKCILNFTGNQWSEAKTGVMCALLLVWVKSLAAEFWTVWRRQRSFLSRQIKNSLNGMKQMHEWSSSIRPLTPRLLS